MELVITSAGAALFALLAALFGVAAARRAARIRDLELERDQARQRADEAQSRFDEKCKQADELRSKVDQTRDELKRAKKKAFGGEPTAPAPAAPKGEDFHLAAAVEQAQAEAQKARTETAQLQGEVAKARSQASEAQAESATLREQMGRVADEAALLKKTLAERQVELERVKAGQVGDVGELRTQVKKLEDKLQVAGRRARTDAQVYRVTSSKLELAMDKISELEYQLARARGENPAEPGTSPAGPADQAMLAAEQPALVPEATEVSQA